MPRRRRILRRAAWALVALYVLGLAWGHVRLPATAVKNLADYPGIVIDRKLRLSSDLDVSRVQRWHLQRSLPLTSTQVASRVSVSVEWNALIIARVRSSHYTSPTGAEGKDVLYVNVFGAWVPVHTFMHVMA